jgi:hypothetical protein
MELSWDRCRWLKTFRDKEPFSRHGGIQKERVIAPGPGVGTFRFRRSGTCLALPVLSSFQSR